jgi:ABC-type multidrug transport system fused ATPase/permease subunit
MRNEGFTKNLPSDSIWKNDKFYFYVFVGVAVGVITATIIRSILYAIFIRKIVDKLVMDLLTKILKTKQRFFDVTPKGEIMARFSKDQEEIETYLPLLIGGGYKFSGE